MKKLLFGLALLLAACSPKPQAINYGTDECDFCRMTIVDKQHAAEVVTTKGKAFKFDAIECMINYTNLKEADEFSLYLVNDYLTPGELIDATTSTFLISKNIPSPMGAYLSAFADADKASATQMEQSGELYNWNEIKMHLKK
ncbi:MAG: nitrous oxide reductase accessory protein NosL [Saprospiraceae bacterium]|nr:nitrous oxide reductase accessory protein NosL [Saprospiraceae bacterium]